MTVPLTMNLAPLQTYNSRQASHRNREENTQIEHSVSGQQALRQHGMIQLVPPASIVSSLIPVTPTQPHTCSPSISTSLPLSLPPSLYLSSPSLPLSLYLSHPSSLLPPSLIPLTCHEHPSNPAGVVPCIVHVARHAEVHHHEGDEGERIREHLGGQYGCCQCNVAASRLLVVVMIVTMTMLMVTVMILVMIIVMIIVILAVANPIRTVRHEGDHLRGRGGQRVA